METSKNNDLYTPIQKSNVILWFAESGNVESVQNLFYKNFYNKDTPIPDKHLIFKWYNNFRDTGFVDERKSPYKMQDEATEMNSCPVPYLEVIGDAEGDKVVGVQNGIEEERKEPTIFHPFFMMLTKKLYIEDAKERMEFAMNELHRLRKNSKHLNSIWFTGEAIFYTNSLVAVHNLCYSDTNHLEDPNSAQLLPSDRVIVWAAMNSSELLGPYFFLGDPNSESYEMMLREFFFDVRKNISVKEAPIFMHDDSPPSRNFNVKDFLEHEVPRQLVGTGSDYATWPHHSPDLSPLNYFLWGFIKSQIYKTSIEDGDVNDLQHRINVAFKKVSKEMLKEAVDDYKVRLQKVVELKGALVGGCVNMRAGEMPNFKKNRSYHCFSKEEIELDDF